MLYSEGMSNTETSAVATETFTVTIDPTYARSIVATYSDYSEAFARFQRAWMSIKDNGGSVSLYDATGLQMSNNSRGVK